MHRIVSLALLAAGVLAVPTRVFAATLPNPPPCTSCFVGEVRLSVNGADAFGRTKILKDDLYFVDPKGLVWKADKGDVTDGASIPSLLQPIVGNAFENDFLPAAVIHDHYTTKAHYVRTWEDTDMMFYQGLVLKGVPAVKAKTMYYAVYAFGPHWGRQVAGRPCGHGCINAVPDPSRPDTQFEFRPADYDAPGSAPELGQVEAAVSSAELDGRPLSLGDLAGMAKARHAGDAFIDPAPAPEQQVDRLPSSNGVRCLDRRGHGPCRPMWTREPPRARLHPVGHASGFDRSKPDRRASCP